MHSCLQHRMLVCKSARELKPRVTWCLPSTLDINLNTEYDTSEYLTFLDNSMKCISQAVSSAIFTVKRHLSIDFLFFFFFFKHKLLKKGKRKVKLETQDLISFAFRPWAISVNHNSYRTHITRHSPQPCHDRANRHVNVTCY